MVRIIIGFPNREIDEERFAVIFVALSRLRAIYILGTEMCAIEKFVTFPAKFLMFLNKTDRIDSLSSHD